MSTSTIPALPASAPVPDGWRELSRREANGLDIALIWNGQDSRVRVTVDDLSARELEVLRLLPSEMSLREIGDVLYVSHNTVKTHAGRIYRKLGADTRAEAVARARELRLL